MSTFHRNRLQSALAALLPAGVLAAGIAASPALADPSFKVLNRSGLAGTDARFYYLGFGQIGSNFVVLGPDGKWINAGAPGSGWQRLGWNPNANLYSGAGIVPCYPLTSSSTVTIPPNIAGSRVYFFQVNKGSPLFSKPCAASVQVVNKTVNGIFGNAIVPGKGGQAPFSYFSTTGNGTLTGASLAQLTAGVLPLWTYSEVGSGTANGTIDTSQVDFVGFPMNVTAKMIAGAGKSVPGLTTGVGFSFSGASQVNAASVRASYSAFVQSLPVSSKTGATQVATRQNYQNLARQTPGGTILVNPGNYLFFINPGAFSGFFGNIINNYMWKPGWKGSINTGGAFGALPQLTFAGTTVKLASYAGHALPNLYAIKFTAGTANGTVAAYVLSPTSYQALCKAGAIAGCATMSPAYQVFATDGALNTPPDGNQFGLLSPAEKAVWTSFYGGSGNYSQVVARLGFIISMAYNHGVAGGLQSAGGLCAGRLLSACWSDQSLWYPNPPAGKDLTKLYYTGDTTENQFSRWLHTAVIGSVPMMARPSGAIATESGVMGMGYGFASDENPTPPNPKWAQTPSKYDSVVNMQPSTGCNYITIMPAGGTKPNTSPVTACK